MARVERDRERISRIGKALEVHGLDALVCTLPSNVLLLSGYWPVIGNAIAIATREGAIAVIAPEDERHLASNGWADVVRTFQGGSLDTLRSTMQAVLDPLTGLEKVLGFRSGTKVGFEGGASFDPSSYAATFIYGAGIEALLGTAFPFVALVDATECLARLHSVLTPRELDLIRRACDIARAAFLATSSGIHAGMREFEIAARLRSKVMTDAPEHERCDGFAYCMSGPNSAQAYAAFQQSRSRAIVTGDFVLLHCNSYYGGFWTDITRTFTMGQRDAEKEAIAGAVLEASRKAVAAVRPGMKASVVDEAARGILDSRGYAKAFKHATGHGVGFAAINHNALPRIHPLSEEILEVGMVFNIEPAVYIPGVGGMRHCNMVAVTEDGAELLTAFQGETEDLILNSPCHRI